MKHLPSIKFFTRTFLVLVAAFSLMSTRPVTVQERYIEQFKWMAIEEMQRTGIPASIKMAQALHESQSGKSELAINANNHFGIKCKSNWTGETYQYKDDDKDSLGNIIFSCFRSYSTAMDSYYDHSDFIKYRPRYKELFNLPKNDYKAWAYGLKRCGYATDPNYPERLIRLIEKYNLDLLDEPEPQIVEPVLASTPAFEKDALAMGYLVKSILPLAPKKAELKSEFKKTTKKGKYRKQKRSGIKRNL